MQADRDGGWPQLATLILAIITAVLTMIVTWPQLARLSAEFNAPVSSVAWTTIITSLVGTPVGSIMAGLGLFRGNRLMLTWSLAAILGGSLVAVFAPNLTMLIVARGIQGFGVGLLPLAMGIVAMFWSGHKLRRALSLCFAGANLGAVVSYAASALVGDANWRILFYLLGALAALSLVSTLMLVRETPKRKGVHIDWAGAVGLLFWTTLILLPLSQANHWGWRSGRTLGTLLGGVALLGVWCLWELHSRSPLLDLRVLRRSGVWQAALIWASIGFSISGWAILNPYLIQTPHSMGGYGFGRSVLAVSLLGLLVSAISALIALAIPGLMRGMGTKKTLVLAGASGLVFFGMAGAHSALWIVVLWSMLYAVMSAWGGAVFTVATEAVPPEMGAVATGIVAGLARASGAIGSALIGYVLTTRTNSFEVVGNGSVSSVAVPAGETFTWAMLVLGGMALVAILAGLSIRPVRKDVVYL